MNMSNAELSLTPMDTVLVPVCVENFEMVGEGEVLYVTTTNKKFIK